MAGSVTTATFAVDGSRYVREVLWRVAAVRWWIPALPVSAALAAALFDYVWLIVALALVFLMYPTLLFFVYAHYGLAPEAVGATLPHTVTVGDGAVSVDFAEHPALSRRYDCSDIAGVEFLHDKVMILLRKPCFQHIEVPNDAVPDACRADFEDMARNLTPPLA